MFSMTFSLAIGTKVEKPESQHASRKAEACKHEADEHHVQPGKKRGGHQVERGSDYGEQGREGEDQTLEME